MALKSAKFSLFNPLHGSLDRERSVLQRRRAMAPAVKLPGGGGVDNDELRRLLDTNMDDAAARRRVREAVKDTQLSLDHILFKTPADGIKTKEVNSRGVEIFSKSWLPEASRPKAVVCFCHGYGDTCTFFFEGIARKLALSGYGVFAMDYPGFGLSQGLHGYIPSFDVLVEDVIEHYSNVKGDPEFSSLPSFLFGQSMGGAVALKIHFKQPNSWSGAVLVAPMCKIADDMVPPRLLKQILIGLANVLPKQKLVPQKDMAEAAFRDVRKRTLAPYNVICYKDKPRLRTAVELLHTTQEIEHKLEKEPEVERLLRVAMVRFPVPSTPIGYEKCVTETIIRTGPEHRSARTGVTVSLSILILHGEADKVTDPSVSKALYEKASSSDKKIILYEDAYHSLLEGEPDDVIMRVFSDIISWLHQHSSPNSTI